MKLQLEINTDGTVTGNVVASDTPQQGANPAAVQEFIDRMLGSNQVRTPEQQAAYDAAVAAGANKTFNGSSGIRATDLTPADLVYMRHVQENAAFRLQKIGRPSPDVFEALLVGTRTEILRARNDSMDRADVQQERSKFMSDQAAWVDSYSSPNSARLTAAYGAWITARLA